MPEMDGIQCLHALRSQPGGLCQDVPVIALTANAGSDNQLLYRKEGFSGYLAKPVSGALLEAAVLSILPKELVRLSEDMAAAVRRRGKSLKGCMAALVAWSLKNAREVDKEILAKAGISGRVSLGIPDMGQARKIIAGYYLGGET